MDLALLRGAPGFQNSIFFVDSTTNPGIKDRPEVRFDPTSLEIGKVAHTLAKYVAISYIIHSQQFTKNTSTSYMLA